MTTARVGSTVATASETVASMAAVLSVMGAAVAFLGGTVLAAGRALGVLVFAREAGFALGLAAGFAPWLAVLALDAGFFAGAGLGWTDFGFETPLACAAAGAVSCFSVTGIPSALHSVMRYDIRKIFPSGFAIPSVFSNFTLERGLATHSLVW